MPLLKLREGEFQLRKIFSLFLNEMLKIRKKVAVLVLVIIMTVGMAGCSGFFKIMSIFETDEWDDYWVESNIEREQELLQEIELYEGTVTGEDEYGLEYFIGLKYDCQYCYLFGRYLREHDIKETSYKYDALYSMSEAYWSMVNEEFYSEQGTESDLYKSEKAKYEKYDSFIKTGDYKQYIEYKNQLIEQDDQMPEDQKKILITNNNYLYQVCPTGEYESTEEQYSVQQLLSKKAQIEASLEDNVDYERNGDLTEARKEELELTLDVINKRISESIIMEATSEQTHGMSFAMSLSIGNLFTIVIMIILAGAMMSGETSSGTIKSLIIAPVKRWKIYIAKYLALIIMMVIITLYVYITSVLINGLLFGFSSYGTQVYVVFGKAVSVNFFAAQFAYVLCSMVPLLIFTTLAYMMSVATRNTAASISVSMGIYWGGNIIHLLLMGFLNNLPYVTKFLLFNNTEWFGMIFKDMIGSNLTLEYSLLGGTVFDSPSSLGFAVVYVAVLLVCMNWIALDSFCRKDIK